MTDTNRSSDQNTGHGHVFPRPDGLKARCGGPGLCSECSRDLARKNQQAGASGEAVHPLKAESSAPASLSSKTEVDCPHDHVTSVRGGWRCGNCLQPAIVRLAVETTAEQTYEEVRRMGDDDIIRAALDSQDRLTREIGNRYDIAVMKIRDAERAAETAPNGPGEQT